MKGGEKCMAASARGGGGEMHGSKGGCMAASAGRGEMHGSKCKRGEEGRGVWGRGGGEKCMAASALVSTLHLAIVAHSHPTPKQKKI